MRISLEEGHQIIEAVLKFASEAKPGRAMAFAVVDEAGVLVSFAKMDGASALNARMAINKAYTAIDWARDTQEIQDMFFSGEAKRDIAWFGEPKLAPIPGGVLLRGKDGLIVGAVGTSGRRAEEDEELARFGLKAYLEILKKRK